ncbi:hypothetical protein AO379_1017 [Moraxella catarrhalis]|nr:hypothetical protein AO379_1017 [Moraxella catarrhalis]
MCHCRFSSFGHWAAEKMGGLFEYYPYDSILNLIILNRYGLITKAC